MAQADTLVELVMAGSRGDQITFRRAAELLAQEERSKGHRILADRLSKSLSATPPTRPQTTSTATLQGHKDLLFELVAERPLESLFLPPNIQAQVTELVEEQHRSELLHAHNLSPRHRILLAGPPGNGKTTLAEAIACELMVPLLVVRYESLIGSYLGETSLRLKALLDYARTRRCVLFFDEFETLGKERGDTHETGEIKRVVSSLLLQLDALPDYVVVIAASNHPELLDRAVWRRFQLRLELPTPSREQISIFIRSIGERCGINYGLTAETIAKKLVGINFAEVEELCLSIARRAIMDQVTENASTITKKKIEQFTARLKPLGR
jgi:SpoVK/Ycf46/Vps4 family AAA+-type ATPase